MSQLSASGYLTKRLILLRCITFMPVEEHQPALISAINLGLTIQNCSLIDTSLSFFHNAGNESDFWCVGNTFKIEDGLDIPNNWNALYIMPTAKTNQGNCIIYQNNFQVGADGGPSSRNLLVNIDLENSNNVVFVGNTVRCLKGGWEIRARDGGVLSGNSFSGLDATITNYGLFSANHMYNGTLYIIGNNGTSDNINASAVTGNTLKNVSVQISGNVDFSANGVYAPIGETAVEVYKSAPNANQDYSPTVVGNYIIGGNIGVHLLDAGGNIPQSPDIGRSMVNSNKIIGASIPIQLDAHWSNCMVTDNLFTSGSIVNNGSNNIIRNNSDEPGSNSGGTPTTVPQAVPSISVAEGGLVTASATQTAGNVAAGTKSTTHQLSAQDDPDLIPENIREGVSVFGVRGTMQAGTGGVTSETVAVIVTLTEAEYNALSAKDPSTLYLIKE